MNLIIPINHLNAEYWLIDNNGRLYEPKVVASGTLDYVKGYRAGIVYCKSDERFEIHVAKTILTHVNFNDDVRALSLVKD